MPPSPLSREKAERWPLLGDTRALASSSSPPRSETPKEIGSLLPGDNSLFSLTVWWLQVSTSSVLKMSFALLCFDPVTASVLEAHASLFSKKKPVWLFPTCLQLLCHVAALWCARAPISNLKTTFLPTAGQEAQILPCVL